MSSRHISTILFVLTLCAANMTAAADPNIIAQFTNVSDVNCRNDCTFYTMLVTTDYTQAMAFDVNGNPTATEVLLQLSRHQGSDTGNVLMQLCSDLDGAPNNTPITEVSREVNELLVSYPTWFSFDINSGALLTQGRHWIVCKVTGAETKVSWHVNNGNNYGTPDDTKTSTDDANTWPTIKLLDAGFRVFGTRTAESTTTTITADPNIVKNGDMWINVSVRDSRNNPVRGPGQVLLSASGGLFADSNSTNITLTLKDADANTMWTAPDSVTSVDINAFYQGHNYNGIDYNDSNSNSATTIAVLAQDRTTTTFLDITSSPTIFVEQVVDMNVTVRDSNNNLVSGGKVLFSCTPKSGTFAADSVDVSTGKNSNTWTAGLTTGNFTIKASYVGGSNAAGTVIYGPSDSNDAVFVDYNDVDTDTYVRVSPGLPYVGFSAYVIVQVRDEFGDLVPGGTVKFHTSPPYGTFRCPNSVMQLQDGMAYTEWLLPSDKGPNTITVGVDYEWLTPGYTAAGKRYIGSQGIQSGISIVQDDDSTGGNLSWMTEWISDYPGSDEDLPNSGEDAKGFANSLRGWTGREFSEKKAWEDHMKGNIFGQEDSFMDLADVTYFGGHGKPKYVLFNSSHDNTRLNRNDSYDDWGDKDAEWVILDACLTMSNKDWARTMDGLHSICGFVTEGWDSNSTGKVFGSFLRQQHAYELPHTIVQSWFLAGDQTQKIDTKQRVIGDEWAFNQEYIWGQGYVMTDPPNDDTYWGVSHDVNEPGLPDVNAGGPYTGAVAGQTYQLDSSATTGLVKDKFYYFVWDLDTSTNSDWNDMDKNGDDANDDLDVNGPRPHWVFPTAGTYEIRLMVIDSDWRVASDTATVEVAAPLSASESQPDGPVVQPDSNDGIEIVDNFDPLTLPTEASMQGFSLSGYTGYDEMVSIIQSFGLDIGQDIFAAGLDELGNYTTTYDDKEWIVNRHTGALMYLDTGKAYVSPNSLSPPPELPTDPNAVIIADAFIAANTINKQGAVVDNVIAICAEESQKSGYTYTSRIPFQKCVNYRRILQSYGQGYPVVGPGGKITVLIDPNGVVMFMKNCRQAEESGETVLACTSQQAVDKFHELGPKALIGPSHIPAGCNRIEINGVSLGYYEEDFVTLQTSILPVYILDVKCEVPDGVYYTDLYMSAIAVPVEPNIVQPVADPLLPYGNPITFTGSAQGGTSPYSYEWWSDVDGLLSTEPNFTTSSLSVNYQSDAVTCELLPHTISLTVTDSNGIEATEYIEVTVEGLCADFDHANSVNLEDFAKFAPCWLAQLGQDNYDQKKDFNRDSTIDAKDLCVVADEWLQ